MTTARNLFQLYRTPAADASSMEYGHGLKDAKNGLSCYPYRHAIQNTESAARYDYAAGYLTAVPNDAQAGKIIDAKGG